MKKNSDPLSHYKEKRDFTLTPEPVEGGVARESVLTFVVQKHAARSLHYDFRLELDGTLKSWAVPKGPSLDPKQKRLAVHVEDHPLSYADFEGVIPPKQYGSGTVIVWDRGTWEPIGDPIEGLSAGNLKFRLKGEKLRGAWALVRMRGKNERQEAWLLIKERDAEARSEAEFSVVDALPDSVLQARAPIAMPKGAKPGPIPQLLAPQLAALVNHAPIGDDWSYEIKFDGYRMLARIAEGTVTLFTRNGLDWTDKLHRLAEAIQTLNISSGWLDGELVRLGANGIPDFGALQQALELGRLEDLRYFVFDIPFYEGYDLRDAGVAERRSLLSKLLGGAASDKILFSEDFAASGSDMLESACRLGLEGVIGKRKDSVYVSGRSSNWIKLKCQLRQEFVVVGYTESVGQTGGVGALLLGVYDDSGSLQYAGKAGTGFNVNNSHGLKEKLGTLAVDKPLLHDKPKEAQGIWVLPELVAEVSFAEWTKVGRVRHAVFRGLRSDKTAETVKREADSPVEKPQKQIRPTPRSRKAPGSNTEEYDLKVSNPDRVIDSSSGLTKLDLVNYYRLAASRMLPHLVDRPVSLLRAPAGIDGQLFFQKHADTLRFPGLRELDPGLDPGHPALIALDTQEALVGAAQMNVIELHTWNATAKQIEKPDRMVFDLDPGEGLAWPMMLEAAKLTRTLLEEIGLQCFLKTSGGKGLHVVVPLKPRDDWETVKDFSKAVSQHLAVVLPSLFVAVSGPRNRIGRVFVDYIRNSRGATTAAAYSVRARPGLGVSMPCSWQELLTLTQGDQWTITNARERIESGKDPWTDYAKTRQTLKVSMKKILKQ